MSDTFKRFRSAITGRFVSKDEATKKPRTTIGETVRKLVGRTKK